MEQLLVEELLDACIEIEGSHADDRTIVANVAYRADDT